MLFSTGRLFLALEASFPQIAERAPTLLKITVGFIYPREGVTTMAKKKRLISGEKLNSRYHDVALRSGHILPLPHMLTLKTNFSVYEISATA